MARQTSSDTKWIIIGHFLDGFTAEESADMLYKSSRTVYRIRSIFRKYGDVVDPFVARPGRTSELDRHVIDVLLASF
jgi:transposase